MCPSFTRPCSSNYPYTVDKAMVTRYQPPPVSTPQTQMTRRIIRSRRAPRPVQRRRRPDACPVQMAYQTRMLLTVARETEFVYPSDMWNGGAVVAHMCSPHRPHLHHTRHSFQGSQAHNCYDWLVNGGNWRPRRLEYTILSIHAAGGWASVYRPASYFVQQPPA